MAPGIRPMLAIRRIVQDLRDEERRRLIRRIRILGTFLVAALLLMFVPPLIVWAAPATQPVTPPANLQQWWMPLLTPVLSIVGTAIAAIVAALLKKLSDQL